MIDCAWRARSEAEKGSQTELLESLFDPEPSLTVGLMPRDAHSRLRRWRGLRLPFPFQ